MRIPVRTQSPVEVRPIENPNVQYFRSLVADDVFGIFPVCPPGVTWEIISIHAEMDVAGTPSVLRLSRPVEGVFHVLWEAPFATIRVTATPGTDTAISGDYTQLPTPSVMVIPGDVLSVLPLGGVLNNADLHVYERVVI